jgi:hypothetical protein
MTLRTVENQHCAKGEWTGPFSLKIVELGSWKELYTARIPGDPSSFSFFAGRDAVYGLCSTLQPITHHQIVVDLSTGRLEERQRVYDQNTAAYYDALFDSTLIGIRRHRELVQARWPDLSESLRVDAKGDASDFRFTGNRRILIHLVSQQLVCRRAEDFSVLWTRPIDADIDLSARMPWNLPENGPRLAWASYAISADGSTAAVAPRRVSYGGAKEQYYLEILNGKDGASVIRWPLDYKDGIVLSPHGKMLALGEVAEGKSGQLEPTVNIYSVPSGIKIATLLHDRVPWKNRVNAHLNGGIEFTPDGRYLITSANNKVKIWAVEQQG